MSECGDLTQPLEIDIVQKAQAPRIGEAQWYDWCGCTASDQLSSLVDATGQDIAVCRQAMNLLRVAFRLDLADVTADALLASLATRSPSRESSPRRSLAFHFIESALPHDLLGLGTGTVMDLIRVWPASPSDNLDGTPSVHLKFASEASCESCFLALLRREEYPLTKLAEEFSPEHLQAESVITGALIAIAEYHDLPVGLLRPADALVQWDEELEFAVAVDVLRVVETLLGLKIEAWTLVPGEPRVPWHDEPEPVEAGGLFTVKSLVDNAVLVAQQYGSSPA